MSIGQKLLQSAELQPWTLSFTNERLELFYRQYALPKLRRQARMALLLWALLYALYGFLDFWLIPLSAITNSWSILCTVVVLALAVYGLTHHNKFSQYNQLLLLLASLFGGIGLIAKMWLLPDATIDFYYAGLILITFWCYCFSGLRFVCATSACVLMLTIFNLAFLWLRPLPLLSMVSYDFFIISANIIGVFASYTTEQRERTLFLQEKKLDDERRLQRQLALHDRLTGLPNRELLGDRIEQAISLSGREGRSFAGFFIDLDGFKLINDTHGHEMGDLFLIEVAGRLKVIMRGVDTLSRIGGDEFFVLASDIPTEAAATVLAKKLLQQLQEPYVLNKTLSLPGITASIGVCIFPYKGCTPVDIIRRSDQAMYQVKRGGKSGIAFAPT